MSQASTAEAFLAAVVGAWRASLSVSKVVVDVIREVEYQGRGFVRRDYSVAGPRPENGTPMTVHEMQSLLDELLDELDQPPAGVDLDALQTFADVLAATLASSDALNGDS